MTDESAPPVRRRLERNSAADGAILLEVSGRPVPELRVEIAAGRRQLIRQSGRPVLLARVDADYGGVRIHRTGEYASPLPPITAALMRDLAGTPAPDRIGRWSHRLASWLEMAESGPLHDGPWVVTALRPTDIDVAHADPSGYLDWWLNGWGGVLPLNRLPESNDARMKAFRKHVRDDTLAPVFLWWLSGLDGYVVLDGHHRLAAALAENVMPPLIALARATPAHLLDEAVTHLSANYEKVDREVRRMHQQSAEIDRALAPFNIRLGAQVARLQTDFGRTRAWPVAGGAGAWDAIAPPELRDPA